MVDCIFDEANDRTLCGFHTGSLAASISVTPEFASCPECMEEWAAAREAGDPVKHPPHYTWLNGIEVIDITENLSFTLGNVVKYVLRADHKGKPIEDLKKARWYLDRELKRRGHES